VWRERERRKERWEEGRKERDVRVWGERRKRQVGMGRKDEVEGCGEREEKRREVSKYR